MTCEGKEVDDILFQPKTDVQMFPLTPERERIKLRKLTEEM